MSILCRRSAIHVNRGNPSYKFPLLLLFDRGTKRTNSQILISNYIIITYDKTFVILDVSKKESTPNIAAAVLCLNTP